MKDGTPEYIGALAYQLAKLAKAHKLHTLSHLLELASLEAARVCETANGRTSTGETGHDHPQSSRLAI